MDAELQKKRILRIKRKEMLVAQERQNRQFKENMVKMQEQQNKWLLLSVLGSRQYVMEKALHEYHLQANENRVRSEAAIVIQKQWREYRASKMTANAKLSLKTITRFIFPRVIRRRMVKRHEAADIIKQYFLEIHDVSRLMKVVKRFRLAGNTG